ncbi:hypothetical protein HanLR1_Chr00c2416g0843531 [Helianthus annuus]|nr:hypothetical protein HanLR1_Chr00c2416g0843531 [Helianthus annuus]
MNIFRLVYYATLLQSNEPFEVCITKNEPFMKGGGREYEPLSYPAPSTEYRPHGYPVPPRASGYPGAVDVKISNSGQVSGLGPGVHNINEVSWFFNFPIF